MLLYPLVGNHLGVARNPLVVVYIPLWVVQKDQVVVHIHPVVQNLKVSEKMGDTITTQHCIPIGVGAIVGGLIVGPLDTTGLLDTIGALDCAAIGVLEGDTPGATLFPFSANC